MKELGFEWDKRKEAANVKKHGVTFKEARTAFYDESAIQADDFNELRLPFKLFFKTYNWESILVISGFFSVELFKTLLRRNTK